MAESFRPAHASIFARATAVPSAPAIVDLAGNTLSYRDFCRRALSLTASLAAAGVGHDTVVAVRLAPSIDAVAAMVGIMASGAVYLPIDPTSPERRIAELLERSAAAAIVCEACDPALPDGVRVLSPESWQDSPLALDALPAIHPEQLAYLIFTSGSTGAPKGVMMPHRGLSRLIEWQCRSGPQELRTLSFAPVGFDVSLQEVLSTLAPGGTLLLCDERARQDPARLLDRLCRSGAQRIFLPPSALHRLALAAVRADRYPQALEHVVTAGEALVITDAIAGFFRQLPTARLDNHYGPTEAHLVTSCELTGNPAGWPAMPPIGVAVDGVTALLLADDFSEAPAGVVAELYAGGIGVARGYLGDPRATAERFVPDPHAGLPGAVMYRTGDLASSSKRGVLDFAGRADDQIKVSGFRVEPGEVEHALCALDGVREAAVGLRHVADGVPLLVACIVADGPLPGARAMSDALAARLPEFMVPARFVPVPALPKTESGKIDRAALAVPIDAPTPVIALAEPAQASLDEVVRHIWARVLGHDDFDDDEDFFDVGGDSLLAAWVVNELSRVMGREVSLSMFLDASSVESMAVALAAASWRPAALDRSGELVTLRPGPPGRLLFLLHPLGGEVLAYRDFARALATPVRVIGLRLTGTWRAADFTLEELAAAHVQEIVAVEPHGPYRLAGWSFGGTLAYEVARQLRARGEQVGFLGLIDANPALDPLSGARNHDTRYFGEIDALLAGLDGADDPAMPQARPDGAVAQLLGGEVPEGMASSQLASYLVATRASLAAVQAYVPSGYDSRVDLFEANEAEADLQAQLAEALRRLAGDGLRIHPVEAGHFSILRQPAAQQLARSFDAALRECLAVEELV